MINKKSTHISYFDFNNPHEWIMSEPLNYTGYEYIEWKIYQSLHRTLS